MKHKIELIIGKEEAHFVTNTYMYQFLYESSSEITFLNILPILIGLQLLMFILQYMTVNKIKTSVRK